LFDKIYDTARTTGVRDQSEQSSSVRINDPAVEGAVSTKGSHLVTVSWGPSFDSTREMASDFADVLMQSPLAPRIADLAVKLKNLGPIGDEIAERLTPPEFLKPGKDGKPDPKQLMQQLAMTTQRLQELEQVAAKMKQALDNDRMKAQAELARELINAELQIHLESMRQAGKIEAARVAAVKQSWDAASAAREERIALALDHAHESDENALDRAHEIAQQVIGGQQADAAARRDAGLEDNAAVRDAALSAATSRPSENGAGASA
jgi:hypothetical protein